MRRITGVYPHLISEEPDREVYDLEPTTGYGPETPIRVVLERRFTRKYTVKMNGQPLEWKGEKLFPSASAALRAAMDAVTHG